METKRFDVNLPMDLYIELKKKKGTITENINAALQMYLSADIHQPNAQRNHEEYIQYLKDSTQLLKESNPYLKEYNIKLLAKYLEQEKNTKIDTTSE